MKMSEFKHILFIGLSLLVAFSSTSCKKDEESESSLYLSGAPSFNLPKYGVPGQVITLKASGVKDEDYNDPDYFWYLSTNSEKKDSVNTYTLTLPDSLFNLKVTCSAYAEGYYNSTSTKTISIVSDSRENGSIKGKILGKDDFTFTDPRDGKEYWCTTIGNKDWFKENLAYASMGASLENCDATSNLFGHYYTWEEAVKACPEGWRLCSNRDWADAAETLGTKVSDIMANIYGPAGDFLENIYFNGECMWEYWPSMKITNKLGLCIMPTGFADIMNGTATKFDGFMEYAVIWTSDIIDEEHGAYRYIYESKPNIMLGTADKTHFGASVRCVRDHE